MRVKKVVKKIAALGAGVSMIGATLLGAAAADLSQYPSPLFIKNGQFDGTIVIGDAPASPEDVVGAIDIATSLQYSVGQPVASSGTAAGSVTASGDVASISQSNDMLEVRERIGWVKETLTEYDLAGLQGGTIVTDEGATDYSQYLKFEGDDGLNKSAYVDFKEDDDDVVGDYLFVNDNDYIFEFRLEFEEGAESDISTGGSLDDLEDEELNILGKVFTIVNADIANGGIDLDLLGGDVLDTMEEGETRVYTIDGKEYTVNLLIVSDNSGGGEGTVKFVVNGEVTDELEDGETDVLRDGIEIGIRDILPNEAEEETGGDLVEFFLGANKVQLSDSNYSDDTYETGVEIHEESIEEAEVKIKASNTTTLFEMTSIHYRLDADGAHGDIHVPSGHGVKEYLDEPEGMLSDAWDIRYEGLTDTGVSVVKIDASGDDAYKFEFTNREGLEYDFPLVDTSDDLKWGDEDDDFVFQEGHINLTAGVTTVNGSLAPVDSCGNLWNIDEDDYFLLTDGVNDENAFSHILRYDSIDTTNHQMTFSDEATGQREVTYDLSATACLEGTTDKLIVGGNTFEVWISNGTLTTNNNLSLPIGDEDEKLYPIIVDQDGDGDADNTSVTLTINGGGIFNFTSQVASVNGNTGKSRMLLTAGFNMTLRTLAKEFDSDGVLGSTNDEVIRIEIDGYSSATELDIDVIDGVDNASNGEEIDVIKMYGLDDEDLEQGLSTYGVFFEKTDDTDSADDLTIEYPLSQRGADVFVVIGESQFSRVGAATGGAVVLNPINVGSSKLASEIRGQEMSMNMIVVGGPCINTAAAKLMDSDSPLCGDASGLKPGQAVIKLFENGDYVSMLVAGYSKEDTRRGCKVVAEYESWADKFVGDELVVTGTSMSDIDVATPTTSFMAPAEEPAMEEAEPAAEE